MRVFLSIGGGAAAATDRPTDVAGWLAHWTNRKTNFPMGTGLTGLTQGSSAAQRYFW